MPHNSSIPPGLISFYSPTQEVIRKVFRFLPAKLPSQVEGEVRELKNMKDSHRQVRLVDLEVTNEETERLKAEGYEMAPSFILISPR